MTQNSEKAIGKARLRLFLVSAVVLFVGGWAEAAHLGLTSASSQLEEQKRQARLDGLPLTPSDLAEKPVPDQLNALGPILEANKVIRSVNPEILAVLHEWQRNQGRVARTDEEAEKALALLQPAMVLGVQAAYRPYLDLQTRWIDAADVEIQGLTETRMLATLFVQRAHLARTKHQSAEAIQSLVIASRLANKLSGSHSLISVLVQQNIETFICEESSNLLTQDSSPAVLMGLRHVVETFGPMPRLRSAMQGEFLSILGEVRHLPYRVRKNEGSTDDSPPPHSWRLLRYSSVADLNEANVIRHFREEFAALPNAQPSFSKTVESVRKADSDLAAVSGFENIAVDAVMTGYSHIIISWFECMARRRVLSSAIKLFEIRNRTGEFPAKFDASSASDVDPFTEKSFAYRREGPGFIVYSFGKDRKDNGGHPANLEDQLSYRGLAFEYPHTEMPRQPVKRSEPMTMKPMRAPPTVATGALIPTHSK